MHTMKHDWESKMFFFFLTRKVSYNYCKNSKSSEVKSYQIHF